MNGEELKLFGDWSDEEVLSELARLQSISHFVETHCRVYDPEKALQTWVILHPAIPRPVERIVSHDWRRAATAGSVRVSKSDSSASSMQFVYASIIDREDPLSWRAELTVPESVDSETVMDLSVCRSDRTPCTGTFILNGLSIPLQDGHGSCRYRDFAASLKCSKIALKETSGRSVAGTLVFA